MIFISGENGSSFLIKIVLATIIQSMQRYRMKGKGDSINYELSLMTGHSRIFHSYGRIITTGEGLQILTDARHSWPLSNEGS